MAKYQIEIVETLNRIVEVEADSSEEAIGQVEAEYENGEHVLSADDMTAPVEFNDITD